MRPRGVGVAVPSDDAVFDEVGGGAGLCDVMGMTVLVDVVEKEDADGAGEFERGVGVDEGDCDCDLGRLAASASAC